MPEHVGLFIPLPERLARQYPPDGKEGEDSSPPHLTLVYIGDVPDDKVAELRDVLKRIVQAIPPLELKLLPPTTFKNDDGQTIVHSPVSGPLLERAHNAIDTALKRRGFDVQGYDEFKPHVTIEYVDPGEQPKFNYVAPKGQWMADSVGFWVGDDRRSLPFNRTKAVQATRTTAGTAMQMMAGGLVLGDRIVKSAHGVRAGAVVEEIRVQGSGKRSMMIVEFDDGTTITVGRWTTFDIERGAIASLMNPGVDDAAIIVSQKYAGAYGRFLSRGGIGKLPALSRILSAEHKRWQQTQKVGTPFTLDELTREYIELQTPAIERAHDREGAAMSAGLTTLTKQPYRSMVERLIGKSTAKRDVIACLIRAERPDLANVVAYGQRTADDLLRSINTLAKYSEGLWKSEKQGNFLLDWAARDDSLQGGREAVAWAKQTGWYDPKDKTQVVLQFILSLPNYGKRDPTKIRYAGTFALLNGTGVLATASFKVKHAKKGEDSQIGPLPGTAKTRFVRDRKVVPDMNVDPAGDEARRVAKQLKLNEPVVKAIESIPGWKEQQIFVDFHDILMAGGTLSPNMMRVVERNVPLPVHNVGDADDVLRKMQELDRWVQQVFLPESIEHWQEVEKIVYERELKEHTEHPTWHPRKPVVRDRAAEVKQEWADYLAGNSEGYGMLWQDLNGFITEELKFNFYRHFKGARGVYGQEGYRELRPQINKAVPLLKRGKSPTKSAMVVIRAMLALHDKMAGLSRDRIKRYLDRN